MSVRSAVCRFLASRLRAELANVFPSTEPLREDERFNGTFGFRIATKGARRFFLTVLAGEGNETFRVNVAYGDSDGYPAAPFSDVRASLADFLRHSESEFQLAVLSPADIPWSWDLDRSHAMWHSEMVRLQSRLKPGDAASADAFARHLREMPKRCTAASATAAAVSWLTRMTRLNVLGLSNVASPDWNSLFASRDLKKIAFAFAKPPGLSVDDVRAAAIERGLQPTAVKTLGVPHKPIGFVVEFRPEGSTANLWFWRDAP
jgi:hypothetical protein